MRRRPTVQCLLLSCGVLLLNAASPAATNPPSDEGEAIDLESLATLDEELLAEQRGGFTFQGMTVSLGAEFRTFVQGELAIRTNIAWGPDGVSRSVETSAAVSAPTAEQLQAGLLSTGSIRMRVGDDPVFLANDGMTAFIHRTDGGLQNMLINTASNQNLRQEADVAITLSGYDGFSQGVLAGTRAAGVGDAMALGGIGALDR